MNLFRILENGCRYSVPISNKLFGESTLLRDLCAFMPDSQSGTIFKPEDYPFFMEVIHFMNALLSE